MTLRRRGSHQPNTSRTHCQAYAGSDRAPKDSKESSPPSRYPVHLRDLAADVKRGTGPGQGIRFTITPGPPGSIDLPQKAVGERVEGLDGTIYLCKERVVGQQQRA